MRLFLAIFILLISVTIYLISVWLSIESERYIHPVFGSTNRTRQELTGLGRNHVAANKHQTTKQQAKFFFAFSFPEQLTRATENLLSLAAVAKYGERNVVVPFVKDSSFYGTKVDENTETLSRYFDLKELNRKLDSYGYGLLTSSEHFQKHCNGRLDVLLEMRYHRELDQKYANLSISQRQRLNKTGWTPYSVAVRNLFEGFYVKQTIGIDPNILTSLQQLESDVLQGSSCIGFMKWKGIGPGNRSHFDLSSDRMPSPFSVRHDLPLNPILVRIAQDFATKQLGNSYISVHIRSEWVLTKHESNMTHLFECLRELSSRLHVTKEKTGLKNIFLATDFSKFGSKTSRIRPAQEKSEMLFESLDSLLGNHDMFDPNTVGLSDRGSVTIVELSILSAGKKLFLVGGGNFEDWIKDNFEKAGNNVAEKICYKERPEIIRSTNTGIS